jgi:hypothetical protein
MATHHAWTHSRNLGIGLLLGLVIALFGAACMPGARVTPTPTRVRTATATRVPPTPTATPLPAAVGPVAPHSLDGRGDCLACHLSMWPVPLSHAGRENGTCQTCHIAQTDRPLDIAHP